MSGIHCSIAGATYATGPAFISPTAEFTNDADTKLLLHFNGTNGATTTTDDGAGARTARTVTANGNAQVDTAQSKFGGASALFDGTTDGLSVDNSDFAFGTGDFTYECFVRVADTNAFMLFDGTTPTGSSNAVSVWVQLGALYVYSGGWTYQGVGTINNNTWYHVAVSRSSSNIRVFIDGTQVGSTQAFSVNFTQSILHMGKARVDAGYDGNGHMDEIRVSNSARYTANFTAPTAAFVNDANTRLLLHCDGTDGSTTFTDDVGSRTAKTVTLTTSSLNTTTKKFGTASLSVDGTGGDRATIVDTADVDLQAAPRTFECWVYINSFTNISRNSPDHLPKLMGHMDQGGNIYWTFGPNTDQGMSFYYWSGGNNWFHSTKKDLVTGQWYHMALIVTATGAKGYVDGVEYLSSTLSNTPVVGNTIFSIGSEFGQSMNAYIDEVRISHVNRYT